MELWDIIDENRQLVGKTIERGTTCLQNEYRLVVHLCIFNSKNEMLIQQRQPFKKGWPNMWDISVGGSATIGETSKDAVHRETLEELGLDINFTNERAFLTINFDTGFDDFYLIKRDIDLKTLKLQYEEVQNVKWASKLEVQKMINNGQFIPYYNDFINSLFEMYEHRGAHKISN